MKGEEVFVACCHSHIRYTFRLFTRPDKRQASLKRVFFPAGTLQISELLIRGSKGYFSIEFLKISIEIEVEGVKIFHDILDFSNEIKFRG